MIIAPRLDIVPQLMRTNVLTLSWLEGYNRIALRS